MPILLILRRMSLQDSKYPTFVNMYNVMKNNPDVFVEENHEGLSRAQNENYAYLMESTSLLYYTERVCNVTMVGDLIDDRNYAIGMRKGYKYYNTLSEGILRLQERGVMDKLHTKWWKAKRGGGACQVFPRIFLLVYPCLFILAWNKFIWIPCMCITYLFHRKKNQPKPKV